MKTPVMVDAGVVVRGLLAPPPAGARGSHEVQRSADLLRRVASGEVQIAMTDAVISEIATVLVSRRYFRLSREDAAHRLRGLFTEPGVRVAGKAAVLAALDRWARDPATSFSHALSVERAADAGAGIPGDAPLRLPAAGSLERPRSR
ncbi:MAG: hypothetical protein ACKOWF_07410 [Chloroflexota bacterium]